MEKEIKLTDFGELALELKPTLETHGVPEKFHYSLISDVLFTFANFLDEKNGTDFHEQIYPLMDELAEKLSAPQLGDFQVAEVIFEFEKGRKVMNLLKSQLDHPEILQFDLEFNLGLRGLDEIDNEIDADARFLKLLKTKRRVKSLKFNSAKNYTNEDWISVSLEESEYGSFEQSLSGIQQCIREVVKQWL